MAKLVIEGGKKLSGKIQISGNKNAILPCIAAALLTEQEVILKNTPKIVDVSVMLEIVKTLGVDFSLDRNALRLNAKKISHTTLPKDLTSKLRASVLLVGPLLAREGSVEFFHPGGDIIGKRSIDIHLQGFKKLGFECQIDDRKYTIKRSDNFTDSKLIFLEEPSVTGTENLILASVLGKSEVLLKNCAKEPHITDLCQMLLKMGAKIEGVGSSTLKIIGVEKLNGCEFTISSDYVEMATYAIAASITKGEIEIENCTLRDLEPIILPLSKMGVEVIQKDTNSIKAYSNGIKAVSRLYTNVWPGFPTDLMSVFIVLATQANGISLMHDWMYESRMFFVDKLISMGANITIADPHRVLVYGPTQLRGRELETPDIRAGMALVLASLVAKGESEINKAELIERGYEDVVGKLSSLGAKIKRLD